MKQVLQNLKTARPDFMKIAPIIDASEAAQAQGSSLRFRLVHRGGA